jgi:two-component system nitrogen regulation response regulator GlnG
MPPLRERGEDIPQIVDFCLQNLVKQKKARVTKVSPEAMAALVRHDWPGNVRELENVIYRSAVIAQGDAILVKDLPAELRAESEGEPGGAPIVAAVATPAETEPRGESAAGVTSEPLTAERALDFLFVTLGSGEEPLLARIEREFVTRALVAADGDAAVAAKRLGLTKAAVLKRAKPPGLPGA